MKNIRKKDFRGISYFRYTFCNQWDSNQLPYLILTETLTVTLLRTYKSLVF